MNESINIHFIQGEDNEYKAAIYFKGYCDGVVRNHRYVKPTQDDADNILRAYLLDSENK